MGVKIIDVQFSERTIGAYSLSKELPIFLSVSIISFKEIVKYAFK